MDVTYGKFDPTGGDDYLVPVNFPSLATMDVWTPDGRKLSSGGGGARPLPFSIMGQFTTARGHDGAEVVGVLQEMTLHDDGNISGRGWLVNTPEGHKQALLTRTGALARNSVDLADVKAELEWASDDPESPDYWTLLANFVEWKVATTTFVNIPAMPDAHGEIAASFIPQPDEVLDIAFEATDYTFQLDQPEVLAAGVPTVPFADFHRPEARVLTKLTVDAEGKVYGHLAAWGQCHEGIEDRCVLAPRPRDYTAFCQPGVLTDRGIVDTGPIFFLGGHPAKPLGDGDRWAAYGGIENAWADVRVVNGVLGPWVSGRVRPGMSADAMYAARASRVSGHWRTDGTLAAIVSVNVPGYNIPGSTLSADRDGFRIEDGKVVELVASLHAPDVSEAATDRDALAERLLDKLTSAGSFTNISFATSTNTHAIVVDHMASPGLEPPVDEELERLALELELEIELAD